MYVCVGTCVYMCYCDKATRKKRKDGWARNDSALSRERRMLSTHALIKNIFIYLKPITANRLEACYQFSMWNIFLSTIDIVFKVLQLLVSVNCRYSLEINGKRCLLYHWPCFSFSLRRITYRHFDSVEIYINSKSKIQYLLKLSISF